MKFRGTLGGLNIQLDADDTPQSVLEPLGARTALLASGVILEIDGEAQLDTFDAVRRAIEQAGGEIKVLRAPRVNAPAPRLAEPSAPVAGSNAQQEALSPALLDFMADTATNTSPNAAPEPAPLTATPESSAGITQSLTPEPVVVASSLRAGFRGEYAGSVVVLGDVNPGAELVAGGDVIVLGALRGVVHAGADGREDAIVWARPIASAQIRIAGAVARAAQTSSMGTMKKLGATAGQAEAARLQGGQIVIERSHTPPVVK